MKNRVLKFRVWDKINKTFLEHDGEDGLGGLSNFIYKDEFEEFSNPLYTYVDDRKSFSVQQFTGLKDRRGKDIYEGDIVKVNRCCGQMIGPVLQEKNGAWYCDGKNSDGFKFQPEIYAFAKNEMSFKQDGNLITIIGNIYQNARLLKSRTKISSKFS